PEPPRPLQLLGDRIGHRHGPDPDRHAERRRRAIGLIRLAEKLAPRPLSTNRTTHFPTPSRRTLGTEKALQSSRFNIIIFVILSRLNDEERCLCLRCFRTFSARSTWAHCDCGTASSLPVTTQCSPMTASSDQNSSPIMNVAQPAGRD